MNSFHRGPKALTGLIAAMVLLTAAVLVPFLRSTRRETGLEVGAWGLGAALVIPEIIGQGPLVFLPAILP
jgi:hypothetical protein